jgi:hypothetical protein
MACDGSAAPRKGEAPGSREAQDFAQASSFSQHAKPAKPARLELTNEGQQEKNMANREQRSNREKKKPKQSKDKGKNVPPPSPFASQPQRVVESPAPMVKK